jgi:hypothetical protein
MAGSATRRAAREAYTERLFGFVVAWYRVMPSVPWGDRGLPRSKDKPVAKIDTPTTVTDAASIAWKTQLRSVWGKHKAAIFGVTFFGATAGGFTMIQVDEYFGALICWTMACSILVGSLFRSQIGGALKALGCFLALVLLSFLVSWTVIKRGDKPWSAFLVKTPEEIGIEVEEWLKPRTVVHSPESQYYFKLTLPTIYGEEVEIYMLNSKDSRHELGIRRSVIGTPEVQAFVDGLPPKLQRQLVYHLQIELGRVNPTFYWVVDPTRIAIFSYLPINSSLSREQLNKTLNELDSLTLILQRTLILWAEEHGYEDMQGYERFQKALRR